MPLSLALARRNALLSAASIDAEARGLDDICDSSFMVEALEITLPPVQSRYDLVAVLKAIAGGEELITGEHARLAASAVEWLKDKPGDAVEVRVAA